MKKLLFILFAAVAIVGCTKDAELDSAAIPESFTVAELTRAGVQKESWALNDQIAIFESSDLETPKCYYVADLTDRKLEPSDTDDQFYAVSTNKYVGFYPYVAGQSYDEYMAETTKNFSDKDIIWSGGGKFVASADLAFTHSQSYLSFGFTTTLDAGFDSLVATLYLGEESEELDVEIDDNTATAGVFVAPLDATAYSAMTKMELHIVAKSDGTPIYNIVDLSIASGITSWAANTSYSYDGLTIE
ncbi:MAG: hypothetical protein R3Y39_08770 [Rikenellaceae bacterium]